MTVKILGSVWCAWYDRDKIWYEIG